MTKSYLAASKDEINKLAGVTPITAEDATNPNSPLKWIPSLKTASYNMYRSERASALLMAENRMKGLEHHKVKYIREPKAKRTEEETFELHVKRL